MAYRILRVKTNDVEREEILQASLKDGNTKYQSLAGIHTFEDASASKFPNLEETLQDLEIPFDSFSLEDGQADQGWWCSYRPQAEEEYGCFSIFTDSRPKGWEVLQDC